MNPLNNAGRWLILAFALAAIVPTAAQAGARQNDHAGTSGRIARYTSDVVSRYLQRHATRLDERAGSTGATNAGAPEPDVFERYAAEHPYGVGLAALPRVGSGGFRWGDYGAGVGTGVVAMLLLAGAVLATPIRRRQRTQPAIGR